MYWGQSMDYVLKTDLHRVPGDVLPVVQLGFGGFIRPSQRESHRFSGAQNSALFRNFVRSCDSESAGSSDNSSPKVGIRWCKLAALSGVALPGVIVAPCWCSRGQVLSARLHLGFQFRSFRRYPGR